MSLSRIGSVCAYFALARAWKHEALSIEGDLSGAPLGYRGGLPESKLSNHSRRSDHSSHSDHSERSDHSNHSMRSVELFPTMSNTRPEAAKSSSARRTSRLAAGRAGQLSMRTRVCVCAMRAVRMRVAAVRSVCASAVHRERGDVLCTARVDPWIEFEALPVGACLKHDAIGGQSW